MIDIVVSDCVAPRLLVVSFDVFYRLWFPYCFSWPVFGDPYVL